MDNKRFSNLSSNDMVNIINNRISKNTLLSTKCAKKLFLQYISKKHSINDADDIFAKE